MNTPLSDETLEQIKSAIFARHKIEAIKILRNATPLQLMEAKEWIEKLTSELEAKEPEKFAAKASGCSTAVIVLTFLAIVTGVVRTWLT